jgi:hypothetical protein
MPTHENVCREVLLQPVTKQPVGRRLNDACDVLDELVIAKACVCKPGGPRSVMPV